ncbi:MAG: hypothetical protein RSC19_05230 [Lachnospiraceae bacterium]
MSETKQTKLGSLMGLFITVAIGFACFIIFPLLAGSIKCFSYNHIVNGISSDIIKQIYWFFMNFTEPNFFAGIFSGVMVIIGGIVAWILSIKNSKFAGFDVCYGSSTMFPWVLASQLISLTLAIFVFRYINWFDIDGTTWIPTFIAVVGAPPSIMLMYGPSISALLTSSVLGGLVCAPTAYWLANKVIPVLGVPGVVANVAAMAISGFMICYIVKVLPFIKKVPIAEHRKTPAVQANVFSASWSVRRALAEFSEPHFYGNEIASLFLLAGLVIDCLLNKDMAAYGSGTIGAILLSQFVGAGVGIFLYAHKFENNGWYATYVPVVSVGPACVLMFGGTIPVALLAGVLGGIMGAPVADFFAGKLPDGVHGTNANVTSMAICTIIVAIVLQGLGF